MTDGQWLFATFLALYLMESIRWLPPQAVLLVGSGGEGGWKRVRPSATFRFRGRAAIFLPLLPPLQAWRLTSEWPLVPSEEVVAVAPEDRGAPALRIPWADLAPAAHDSRLRLTALLDLPVVNEAEARRLAAQLSAWKALEPAAQEAAFLAEAERTLAQAPLKESLLAADHGTRWLRWLGSSIAIWSYGGISWLYWRFGESNALLVGVIVLFGLMITQASVFLSASKRHRQNAGTAVPWRWLKTMGILLFPPMAIRAADHLLALQTPWSHPLAARGLVPEKSWQTAASEAWRMAAYQPEGQSPGLEALALQQFFKSGGVAIQEWDAPPKKLDATQAYCPRCRAVFTASAGVCADCGGVRLIRPSF